MTLRPEEKEGQFCGVFSYKAHVQLAFRNGTALRDPAGVLQGTGKLRRHINFTCLDAIDPDSLAPLLSNAVAFSQAK